MGRSERIHTKFGGQIDDDDGRILSSGNGTYIYLTKQTISGSAQLRSGKLSLDKEKCMVLWYKMDDTSSLMIYTTANNSAIFKQTENNTNYFWGSVSIPLFKGQSSEIVVEGTLGTRKNAYIALDDIDIQDWHCDGSLHLGCNFEENWCNFEKKPPKQQNEQWERIRALNDIIGRPSVDHTNGHGFYIYSIIPPTYMAPSYYYHNT
ncbi:unnamed protein product [Mytilus coruscus]|uniref:MAM domain-containing protein n=1 Tax=Mytilus coruscus TaxID=42192 RepID=A0A6J8CK45_MYTCO|nr:unnamed protein product [Mytilus coruscus]